MIYPKPDRFARFAVGPLQVLKPGRREGPDPGGTDSPSHEGAAVLAPPGRRTNTCWPYSHRVSVSRMTYCYWRAAETLGCDNATNHASSEDLIGRPGPPQRTMLMFRQDLPTYIRIHASAQVRRWGQ